MKKIISCILAAVLVIPCFSALGVNNGAYAITYILDEQEKENSSKALRKDTENAMAKNAEAFLELMEKTEVTNDMTKDDLVDLLFEASKYSAVKGEGAYYEVYEFNLTKATASKEGSLKAAVCIGQNDVEKTLEVNKVIAKLESGEEEEEEEIEEETTESESLEDSFDYKTAFQEAKTAINSAIWDFDVSNDTTKNDIIKMAKDALPKGSKVTVTIKSGDFSLLKATTTLNGTLSATLTLTLGTQTEKVPVAKTIEEVATGTSTKIDADRNAVGVALKKVPISNKTTKEEILNAVLPEVKNGTQVSWSAFSMQKATFSEEGKISASLKFVLGEEERKTEFVLKIDQLQRKIPTDKLSVNADEWDILRLSNNARAACGVHVLSMTETLQETADIRESELLELFSHTRPNGELCFTALPSDYKYLGAAENIAADKRMKSVPYSSEDAVKGWVNSPDHYANMINSSLSYVGMGYLSVTDQVVCVQMFTGGISISDVETSAGTFNFEDTDALQKEYLICTGMDGAVSYLPLDIEQMEKIDGGYKLDINRRDPVIFTIGGENNAYAAAEENKESQKSFSDVPKSAYYAEAVNWAVKNNVTAGTSETTFSPDDTCTRAQILTFMWRAFGTPEPSIKNPFSDVKETDYYCKAAVWAYEKGMVAGTKFEAATPCKRSDTVKYFWQYAGSPKANATAFSDVSSESDYFDAVNWAVANGITSGTSNTEFSPELICSRAQIVTFLLRAVNAIK